MTHSLIQPTFVHQQGVSLGTTDKNNPKEKEKKLHTHESFLWRVFSPVGKNKL